METTMSAPRFESNTNTNFTQGEKKMKTLRVENFVGTDAFSRKLGQKITSNKKHSICWPAFFLTPIWCGYRRQWKAYGMYISLTIIAVMLAIIFKNPYFSILLSTAGTLLIANYAIKKMRKEYREFQRGYRENIKPSWPMAFVSGFGYLIFVGILNNII